MSQGHTYGTDTQTDHVEKDLLYDSSGPARFILIQLVFYMRNKNFRATAVKEQGTGRATPRPLPPLRPRLPRTCCLERLMP